MQEKQIISQHDDIVLTMKRLAFQIAENHVDDDHIILIGLNERGTFLSTQLQNYLKEIISGSVSQYSLFVSDSMIIPKIEPLNSSVIIVDDVVNSGYTAMKIATQVFEQGVKSIETAFLAERTHRSFPIQANYVGLSISTTLKDHVYFDNSNPNQLNLYLA